MRYPGALFALFLLVSAASAASAAGRAEPDQGRVLLGPGAVLSSRERVAVVNEVLRERLETLLPRLMRETGIDMWLVINREYVEDPVYLTLVPEPVFSARRTTILLFFDRGPDRGVERLTVSRYPLGDFYEAAWEGGTLDEQWRQLAKLIADRNPRRIGIDTSRHWSFGDGLTAGLRDRLMEALDAGLRERVTSAEALALRWLETRTERELDLYSHAVGIARGVIAEAFSERVITPGATTPEDVAWYVRERFEGLGLSPWFQPSVDLQRRGVGTAPESAFLGESSGVIRRGDVLHTDVGFCYLRLCTDTQEMGYVLLPGEDDVPEGLKIALGAGNRWQDLLTSQFATGRTGNQVLEATHAATEAEGILDSTYTHPIGNFGHAAGPTIGMWDDQGPFPVRGEWPLYPGTCYAIEGNVRHRVPEWDDQWVQIKLEQSATFDGERVLYLAGRQTEWHVVR